MLTTSIRRTIQLSPLTVTLALATLGAGWNAHAQPRLLSSDPANLATGVSRTGPFVFTFSEAMNPDVTSATFMDSQTFAMLDVDNSWSGGNAVLTCTPVQPFPANRMIIWSVDGESATGEMLADTPPPAGVFTTGGDSGGGGSGSGTNASTGFVIGIGHNYTQTNDVVAPDPNAPYSFSAITSLASNRTASAITLQMPTGSLTNLTQNFQAKEVYWMFDFSQSLVALNGRYPAGNYLFTVTSTSSNQQVSVNLPTSLQQPNSPRVSNYTETQSVDPSQPFILKWDAFQGGSAADFIYVNVGAVFQTPDPGKPEALNGTATSVAIPADALSTNSEYEVTVGFYRGVFTTNAAANYFTTAYRSTTTHFQLLTSSGQQTSRPTLSNSMLAGGQFSFDVTSSPGQSLTVQYSPSMLAGTWLTLLTTNSPGGIVRITDSRPLTNPGLFYRVVTP